MSMYQEDRFNKRSYLENNLPCRECNTRVPKGTMFASLQGLICVGCKTSNVIPFQRKEKVVRLVKLRKQAGRRRSR